MSRLLATSCLAAVLLLVPGCKEDPSKPEYWDKALKSSKKQKDKERTLEQLRESGQLKPTMLPMLHDALAQEKRADVKKSVARLLGEMKDPSSVDPLVAAVDFGATDSAGNGMNKEIAAALGAIGDPKATPTLLRLLKSRDNYTKIEAINALGAAKAKNAVDPLLELATDEAGEPFISKKAIQALGEIADPKAVPALVQMMFKERRGVSFYIESSFALYQIGKPAGDALLPILTGEDKKTLAWAKEQNVIEPAVYAKAAQVMGDLQDTRAEKALISKLAFNHEFLDIKLFVRIRAADALGRLRSKDAAKPLSGMLDEEEASARAEYIRALTRIGSRDAIPALQKAAGQGSWDAREPAIAGIAMLGDEREQPVLEKLVKDEEALTQKECKDHQDYAGCSTPDELVKKHVAVIQSHNAQLEAARGCKQESACWAKALDDKDAGVRARAAYEVGRSGKPEMADELTKRLGERDLDGRQAIIQGIDWLTQDSADAKKRAQASLPGMEKQLNSEKGSTNFVKVNEDLRRLAVKLKRNEV
ncbi:MAG: HEAT repeat domain-containing protein [Myxococcaceae bacterium]